MTQRVDVARNLIFRLGWRFSAWADQFTELYLGALACPYAEVRSLVSSMLNSLDQIRVSADCASELTSSFTRLIRPQELLRTRFSTIQQTTRISWVSAMLLSGLGSQT